MDETPSTYGQGPGDSIADIGTETAEDQPAPRDAFAGRDDGVQIEELAAEIAAADSAGLRELCRIVIERMDRGDLSSLAALQMLRRAKDRRRQLEQGQP